MEICYDVWFGDGSADEKPEAEQHQAGQDWKLVYQRDS